MAVVFDAHTGAPAAFLLDNGFITDFRTGAAGMVAAKHLAREKIAAIAVIGAGAQARYQVEMLALERSFSEVRISGRDPQKAQACAGHLAKKSGTRCLLGPLLCHPENLLLAGLLDEGYDPQIGWIGPGVELDVNVLRETLSHFEAADLRQSLHHTHVGQTSAAILAAQDLRLSMIQRRNQIDISLTNLRGFG